MLTKAIDDTAGQITKANVAIKTCQRYCNLIDTLQFRYKTIMLSTTLLLAIFFLVQMKFHEFDHMYPPATGLCLSHIIPSSH